MESATYLCIPRVYLNVTCVSVFFGTYFWLGSSFKHLMSVTVDSYILVPSIQHGNSEVLYGGAVKPVLGSMPLLPVFMIPWAPALTLLAGLGMGMYVLYVCHGRVSALRY